MDFFPTLLELAGADKSASRTAVDGVSFVPLLRGETQTPHQELFWHYPHYWNGGKISPYSVARVGDWKLIRFYETGREELYNLKSDLSEKNDLAATESGKAEGTERAAGCLAQGSRRANAGAQAKPWRLKEFESEM